MRTFSELARAQQPNKSEIVDAGGIAPLVQALRGGSLQATKHAAQCLWALTQGNGGRDDRSKDHIEMLIEEAIAEPLIALLGSDEPVAGGSPRRYDASPHPTSPRLTLRST